MLMLSSLTFDGVQVKDALEPDSKELDTRVVNPEILAEARSTDPSKKMMEGARLSAFLGKVALYSGLYGGMTFN